MDKYKFLIESARDLERLTARDATEYNLTKASGILRQWFLDREPFIHLVNKEVRTPLKFQISSVETRTIPGLPDAEIDYTSTQPFDGPAKEVKLEGFLNHRCMSIDGENFTVKNIIKCVAHVGGGIHYMPPEDEQEALLYESARQFHLNNRTLLVHAIADIGTIALTGVEPLINIARTRT